MYAIASGYTYVADEFMGQHVHSLEHEGSSKDVERTKPRILIVDDERLIADTITEILEGAGFEVMSAYDGRTALEAATGFRPDYLLSDVLMPRMNGIELAIAIRKMHPAARILLFSGQAGVSQLLMEGQQQGLEFDIVAKPIHPLKLIEMLINR